MKSIVKEQKKSAEIVYPCAFRYIGPETKHRGLIVLATNGNTGTVIHSFVNYYGVGFHKEDWSDFDNKNNWEPFVGWVELQFP
jgi:hypothetical protein